VAAAMLLWPALVQAQLLIGSADLRILGASSELMN